MLDEMDNMCGLGCAVVDSIEDERNKVLEQYLNDDTFYISSDRVYQGNNEDDEFAGMYGPVKSVAGL